MSRCMAEDEVVELTCLVIISGRRNSCPPLTDPYTAAWAADVMDRLKVRQVEVLHSAEEKYRFIGSTGCEIYDCKGELICENACDNATQCSQLFADEENVEIIYVTDN